MRNILLLFSFLFFCSCHMSKQATDNQEEVVEEVYDEDEDGVADIMVLEDSNIIVAQADPESITYYVRTLNANAEEELKEKEIMGFSTFSTNDLGINIMNVEPADSSIGVFDCEQSVHPKTGLDIFVKIGGEMGTREH